MATTSAKTGGTAVSTSTGTAADVDWTTNTGTLQAALATSDADTAYATFTGTYNSGV